jgi:hypothetical protein
MIADNEYEKDMETIAKLIDFKDYSNMKDTPSIS